MSLSFSAKTLLLVLVGAVALSVGLLVRAESSSSKGATSGAKGTAKGNGCPNSNGADLKLPAGFCATIFADRIGHARDMVVAPNGVVYVNTWSGRYYGGDKTRGAGFLVALQDKSGAGKADVVQPFGETAQSGNHGGSGIGIYKDAIYAETNDRIVRYALTAGAIVPKGGPETIVSGLPLGGDHPMHPFIITDDGTMYVDVASATNSCQVKNRMLKSPGIDPCKELETRGGIWRYDANKTNQTFSPAERYATGIRNGEGFAIDDSGHLFVTMHGRDQLHANWPGLYKPEEEATLPAEELLLLKDGGDYGWPECYYDGSAQKLVLAPEYGGDGKKKVGICADKLEPAAAFPAHWAPNGAAYYDKKEFPDTYRHGVFITFHGSWDRAPYPQGGYNVVYQPLSGDHSDGRCEVFADGFAGAMKSPGGALHRPSGIAVGPDGAMYVSDDVRGTIYRITYVGGSANSAGHVTYCPNNDAPAGKIEEAVARPPEGTHPNAGAAANAVVPPGSTPSRVALGRQIYNGQVGGAGCTGCHGMNAEGSTLGPPLTMKKWLWGDGSLASIQKIIVNGVQQPKKYRNIMPPLGGAQLTKEQISDLTAYVWTLSHGGK
jgi:glucose/arabinose dehydrogenase/mono/diheme cytochrome c family protein